MMKQLHTFDDIFDTQKTFRLLLDAMANPSRVVSIQEGAEKLYGSKPEMLTLAMTLLDKNTGFYTFGHTELDEQILLLTHAEKKTLEEADYVFVTEEEHLPESLCKGKKRHFGKSPYFCNTHHWMQRRKKCVLQYFRSRRGWSGNIPESGGTGRSLSFAGRTGI